MQKAMGVKFACTSHRKRPRRKHDDDEEEEEEPFEEMLYLFSTMNRAPIR